MRLQGWIWVGVAVLGLLWTLLCWAVVALLGWEGWAKGLDGLPLPPADWPDEWPKDGPNLPDWLVALLGLETLANLLRALQSMAPEWREAVQAWFSAWFGEALQDAGAWRSAVRTVGWWIWGLGGAVLLFTGLGFSALVRASQAHEPPLPGRVAP